MAKRKFTISVEESIVSGLDRLVEAGTFESRSAGFEAALGRWFERELDEQLGEALLRADRRELDRVGAIVGRIESGDIEQAIDTLAWLCRRITSTKTLRSKKGTRTCHETPSPRA